MYSFCCLSLLSILVITPVSVAAAPIEILTENWPPFNYSEDKQLKGFSVEVVHAIMKELKVSDPITILPGTRAMRVLTKGPRTMYFSMIRTPEREPFFKWIGPFGEQSIYFFKKRGSLLSIKTLDDAKKVERVCCRNAGLVFNYLSKEGFKNLDVGVNPDGIYLKLAYDRCNLAIGESALGVAYWLKKHNISPDVLEMTSVKIAESPLYIAASKDIPDEEIAQWQRALNKLKKSGEYHKLYQKYLK